MSLTVEEKFWAKVDKNGPTAYPELDPCWPWTGCRSKQGYGYLNVGGKYTRTSRLSYVLNVAPIPPGMIVRHRCDNPPCVNPSHLLVGTHLDNVRDARERGRAATGARNGRHTMPDRTARGARNGLPGSKLTTNEVREIRISLAGKVSRRSLAARFGVSVSAINLIATGRAWWWVDGFADKPAEPKRERATSARLNAEQVENARALIGTLSERKLAARLGINRNQVRRLVRKRKIADAIRRDDNPACRYCDNQAAPGIDVCSACAADAGQ